jgi:hypothetical protein
MWFGGRSLLWWVGKEASLGRKSGSYKFEKRQKELKKQKKKRAKLEKRFNKGDMSDDEPQPGGWDDTLFDRDDSADSGGDGESDDTSEDDDV